MPRGGARPGAGRPPGKGTGRTTTTLSLRLPVDIVEKVHAKAIAAGVSVSTYLLPLFANQFPPNSPEPAAVPLSWSAVLRALERQPPGDPPQ